MKTAKLIAAVSVSVGLFFSGLVYSNAHAAAQTKCPVLDNKIDEHVYLDYQGKRIFFCCTGCPDAFMKNPGMYLKKMSDQGIVPANSPK